MDYDDASYLAEQQQNWRPWFDRGLYFRLFSFNFNRKQKHQKLNKKNVLFQNVESRSRYAMGLGKRLSQSENVERRSPPQDRLVLENHHKVTQ